jgi:simple sugar transport system ATP-binding protein
MASDFPQAELRQDEKKAQMSKKPVVEMRGIKKSFGAVQAVEHADLELYRGEIHALVGGNGSGKSTLISLLSGANRPDAGEIFIDGEKIQIRKPRLAMELGIQTIYQDLCLVNTLSVTANLFLGRELFKPPPFSWLGILDLKQMRSRAVQEFRRLGVNIPSVDAFVGRMSGGQRQAIACARAMMGVAPKVLILDEPTAALGVRESKEVYRLMEACRDEGTAVLFISHDMVEVMEVSDKITVMRLGNTIAQLNTSETSGTEIVGLITGATEPWEVMGKK